MTISTLTHSVERHIDVLSQLGDKEPSSQIENQAVNEHIRAEKGYLDLDVIQDLEALKPENRDYLLRLVEPKKQTEAAYTTRFGLWMNPWSITDQTSVSEQLYSSKYRFLYGVIQNADDSHYHGMAGGNIQPFLRFIVTSSKFVIETNEDGFDRENVEAICAIGRSSKMDLSADDYTGEKSTLR